MSYYVRDLFVAAMLILLAVNVQYDVSSKHSSPALPVNVGSCETSACVDAALCPACFNTEMHWVVDKDCNVRFISWYVPDKGIGRACMLLEFDTPVYESVGQNYIDYVPLVPYEFSEVVCPARGCWDE